MEVLQEAKPKLTCDKDGAEHVFQHKVSECPRVHSADAFGGLGAGV
jgi:hypothetical protein